MPSQELALSTPHPMRPQKTGHRPPQISFGFWESALLSESELQERKGQSGPAQGTRANPAWRKGWVGPGLSGAGTPGQRADGYTPGAGPTCETDQGPLPPPMGRGGRSHLKGKARSADPRRDSSAAEETRYL